MDDKKKLDELIILCHLLIYVGSGCILEILRKKKDKKCPIDTLTKS